ncbi:MAG: HDOD domain-containing protein [Verrucomicrobiota bacterium]|jgi:putative nucleotidyltransferase with HDIG domain
METLVKSAPLARLNSDQIERRLGTCPRLPSLASINHVLQELLDAEQCYTSQIADVIRRDPSMTTRLLRLVNSVYYGLSAPVSSIEEGVFYLGVRQIRRLAVVTPIIEDLERLAGRIRFPWREFWRHCIATAIMTRETLGDIQPGTDEADYVAGLLHDVGKIVMVAAFPEYFERIQARVQEDKTNLLGIEAELLGVNHCELGARYLSAHKLPAVTIQSVRFHHHPARAESEVRIVAAVQVADLFVRYAQVGNSGNPGEVTAEVWMAAEGWDLLFPGSSDGRSLGRANMERSLERLSSILEGLV